MCSIVGLTRWLIEIASSILVTFECLDSLFKALGHISVDFSFASKNF